VPARASRGRSPEPRLPGSCAALDHEAGTRDNRGVAYFEAEPGAATRALVERISFSSDEGEPPFPTFRVVPDGGVDVLFSALSGGACTAHVFGLKTRPLFVPNPEARDNVALRLRPGAAARLFRLPAHALADEAPELRELVGTRADALCARVRDARDARERGAAIEAAFAEWSGALRAPDEDDALLHRMVLALRRTRGTVRIAALADAERVGVRRLERLFRARVGVGPKAYARIVRFHAAYRALAAGADPLDAALAHGYFDHAHLCRDFRELAGAPPRRIFPSAAGEAAASLPA